MPRRLSSRNSGFTLLELLVVVTVIVVLVALLAPALDEAVYQAEQTQCAGQLKLFGTAVTASALERNRRYPARYSRFQPIDLSQKDLASGEIRDERDELREYLGTSLNAVLNCPMTRPVDIDNSAEDSLAQTSYAMWYGWSTGLGERVMRKLGDNWTFADGVYRLLANDYELGNANSYYNGQPDRDGVLVPYVVQDAGLVGGWDKQTTSTWHTTIGTRRGPTDVNAVYTDASVDRVRTVRYHEEEDDRMAFVPNLGNGSTTNNWVRVPAR